VSEPVRWGLLSTAAIGSVVIAANRNSATSRFVAVASRDGVRAQEYAAAHRLPLAFPTYQALLDSPEVDAVYVALPVAMHAEWTTAALRAGKHVLCEKPFALDPAAVAGALDAAGEPPGDIRRSAALGGGAIGDLGCRAPLAVREGRRGRPGPGAGRPVRVGQHRLPVELST
jgi:Oxidoreductase family, NAD-binding Rossmann fold